MSTEATPPAVPDEGGQAYYVHKECDGLTIWDLSGGFCIRCHAEDLDADDVERREDTPPAVDPRESLGRLVHDTRLACEAERAAAEGRRKFNLPPWEERDDWQRELDMRIGSEVTAEALRQYEAERAELTAARMSRSVKLARIRALCRRRADLGDPAEAAVAGEILAIIGSEEENRG